MSFPEVGVPAQDHYWKSHELLTAKYPNLANPDFKLWAKPAQFASPPRIACFQFHADSMTSEAPLKTVFNGLEELKAYLSQTPAASLIFSPTRRIFVMEGLQPSYIAELGRELKVDPRVCFRHQRFALWESTVPTAGNSLRLPSVIAEEGSFCMDYCQLMHLNTVSQDFTSRCAENERHIASSRQGRSEGRKFDGIGIAHRKASFWSRKLDNGGWTALLLVDEQLKRIMAARRSGWAIAEQINAPKPFQGGYQDSIPFDTLEKAMDTSGPPRTSVFDDICYYFEHHSSSLQLSQHPDSCTTFILKLVASEYVQLTHYFHTLLSGLAWGLSRQKTFQNFQISWVEECWSDLIALQRRIDDHLRNLGAILIVLRASKTWHAPEDEWTNPIPDFQFVDEHLRHMKEKAASLVAAFSGLAEIIANRRSLLEARAASALGFVGTVFVPMSLVASILSLPNDFRPTGPHFWQYWAVAIPLVLIIYVSAMWYLKMYKTQSHRIEIDSPLHPGCPWTNAFAQLHILETATKACYEVMEEELDDHEVNKHERWGKTSPNHLKVQL